MIYKLKLKRYPDNSITIKDIQQTSLSIPGSQFYVNEDNKIIVKDYDKFNSEDMQLINSFNNMHVVDRSLHLWDLTNALRRK